MVATFVLGFSVVLQFAAAFLALNLIQVTGRPKAWILIATAVFLMMARRGIALWRLLSGDLTHPPDLSAELVALVISVLMLVGIAWIGPLFLSIKRSGEALRESEERFRQMAEVIPVVFWMFSGDKSRVLYVSPAYEKVYGRPCESLYEDPQLWLEEMHPEDRKQVIATDEKLRETEHELEYRIIRPDGTVRWILDRVLPIQGGRGEIPHIVGLSEDITHRKRAQERIEHLNSALRAIRNVNQLIVVEKDRDTLLQKTCDALVETQGYDAAWLGFLRDDGSCATVAGRGLREDNPGFCERLMAGDYPSCIRTSLAQRVLFRLLDKSEECGECPFEKSCAGEATAIVRIEDAGRLFGILGVSLAASVADDEEERELLKEVAGDIGIALRNMDLEEAHRRAEKALREREKQLRLVVQNVPVLLDAFGADGNVVVWNRECEVVTGYGADEIIDRPRAIELLYPDANYRQRVLAELSDGGDNFRNLELELTRKDGDVRTVSWSKISDHFPIPGWASWSVGVDITERKKAEEALRRRDAILEAASLAARRLLSVPKWEQGIEEVLERLGLATNVSRTAIFKIDIDDDGAIFIDELFAWNAPGTTSPLAAGEEYADTKLITAGFARWEEILRRGDLIHGHLKALPPVEQRTLTSLGIKAILVAPIFVRQEWWGVMVFDDYQVERDWSPVEIDALKAASTTVAAAIQRTEDEKERISLEAKLLQSQKMEAIGSLAGGVAHDFNNILTVIQGYTEFALMSINEDDPSWRDLNEVRRASARAAALTRQLLLFSRRQPIAMTPLNINRTVRCWDASLVRILP